MNRSKAILASLRLANSLLWTRLSSTRPICTRVTHFSHLSSFTPSYHSCTSHFLINTHNQRLCFSTQAKSIVDLVIAYDWSDDLENKLEELNTKLTHETVIYILKKLDKDPPKAYNFFNWVCEENGFRPSS